MGSSTFEIVSRFASWPVDWIIFAVVASVFALESFRSGSSRTHAFSIALPISLLVIQWLPSSFLGNFLTAYLAAPLGQGIEFFVILILLFLLFYRFFYSFTFMTGSMAAALCSGVSTAVIFLVVWLQVPALDSLWHFSDEMQLVFGEAYRLWWLIASFALLAFASS